MKKIILTISIIISLLFISSTVKAESFYEGSYITSYVKKVKDGKTYYLQMQTLNEEGTNRLVYCLEPFEFFEKNINYNKIENFKNYKLSEEQMKRIERIAYYGYGYKPKYRNTYTWYVATQVLIWKEVDKEADIYFTKTLNGERDDSYNEYLNAIIRDVENEGSITIPRKDYKVEYNKSLSIPAGTRYFSILSSDYDYNLDNYNLTIPNVTKSGTIKVLETANDKVLTSSTIYESSTSQDIFVAGIPKYKEYNINIKVLEGDIRINIRKEKGIYSNEATLKNTCYQIRNSNNQEVEKICLNDELSYKTNIIPYGDYYIEEISNGEGYIENNEIYKVTINDNNPHGIVEIEKHLIKNKIDIIKKYCKNDICQIEANAKFEVYDNHNNLVGSYLTNESGKTEMNLGYGHYTIIQTEGIDSYEFIDTIEDYIKDNTSKHYYELYDNYIEENEDKKEEEPIVIQEEPKEEIESVEPEIKEEPKIIEDPIIENETKEEPIIEKESNIIEAIESNTNIKEEPIIDELPIKEEIIEEMPPNTAVNKTIKKVFTYIVGRIKKILYVAVLL